MDTLGKQYNVITFLAPCSALSPHCLFMYDHVVAHPYLNALNIVAYDHAILNIQIQNYKTHAKKVCEVVMLSHPFVHAFTNVGRFIKCFSIVAKVFALVCLPSSCCHCFPVVHMRQVFVRSFEYCECANEQHALVVPLLPHCCSIVGKKTLMLST